jgi:hypothetical protein
MTDAPCLLALAFECFGKTLQVEMTNPQMDVRIRNQ